MVDGSARTSAASNAEQAPRPGVRHEILHAPCLESRRLSTKGRHRKVPSALVVIWRRPMARVVDQALGQHPAQGAIEVRGEEPAVTRAVLNFPDEAPPVALALVEGQEHLEDERFERQQGAGV